MKTVHEYLSQLPANMLSKSTYGFRSEGRPHLNRGLMFLMDLHTATVYGIGTDEESAVNDAIARNGLPHAPCCVKEYGMHDRKCQGYSK